MPRLVSAVAALAAALLDVASCGKPAPEDSPKELIMGVDVDPDLNSGNEIVREKMGRIVIPGGYFEGSTKR
ncbi:MAG: hypothetical protein O3C21_12140 [Verrucomicrobia bacterium]|nr:hypothetical protein [Verrucomicrobiota bacterium]